MTHRPSLSARASVALALAAAALIAESPARAEGNGVLLGDDARLHLSLDVEPRYDSLAGQGGIGADVLVPVFDPPDVILHVRPGVQLKAPSANVDFSARAGLDWAFFTAWLAPTRELSYLGGNVGAELFVGKVGPVSLELADTFSRSDRTTNPALGLGTLTNHNDLAARLSFRPGGGAIEGALRYGFALEAYELNNAGAIGCSQPSCDGAKFDSFGWQTHAFGLEGRWRFLPKTAFLLDTTFSLRLYDNQAANVPVSPLRAMGGLAGLLTEKVRIVLKGGYLNTFSSKGDSFEGFVAHAELGWDPSETAGLKFGVLRSIEPVSDRYGYYEDLRGYLAGKLLLVGRLSFTVEAALDRMAFANDGRIDTQGTLDAQMGILFNKYFRATLGTLLTSRASSEDPVFTYNRAEVYLRLTATY